MENCLNILKIMLMEKYTHKGNTEQCSIEVHNFKKFLYDYPFSLVIN